MFYFTSWSYQPTFIHYKSVLQVAKESALLFNPSVNITSYHDSIFNPEYNVSFFKQFDVVMNALDNKGTRTTCVFSLISAKSSGPLYRKF
jgi:tRNA A37 threonylcarbamoyladenosine dehydratase